MKNEPKGTTGPISVLTRQILQDLKDRGFKYVRIDGVTIDKRSDYMEPVYFLLLPLKELSNDPQNKGIYEPIHSGLLLQWAAHPNEGIKVLVNLAAV